MEKSGFIYKKIGLFIIFLIVLSIFSSEFVFASEGIIIETLGNNESVVSDKTVILDAHVRSVPDDQIRQYFCNELLLPGDEFTYADSVIKSSDFCRILWEMDGVSNDGIRIFDDTLEDWIKTHHFLPEYSENTLTNIAVLQYLYEFAGSPVIVADYKNLPVTGTDDLYYPVLTWAASCGLVTEEEVKSFDLYGSCTVKQLFRMLYYMRFNRVYERVFPITVEEFLQSCYNVMETARTNGYKYGCSVAVNPTTDGIISCDRLVAKALYDLGYIDQPRGGITCGNIDEYLAAHGFIRSTSWADVKRGSIMLVKHHGETSIGHVFVFASDFDMETMRGDRYDAGSDTNIRTPQPLKNVGFWYKTDDIIVYNIP